MLFNALCGLVADRVGDRFGFRSVCTMSAAIIQYTSGALSHDHEY